MRLLKIIDDIVVDGILTPLMWMFWIILAWSVLGPVVAFIILLVGLGRWLAR